MFALPHVRLASVRARAADPGAGVPAVRRGRLARLLARGMDRIRGTTHKSVRKAYTGLLICRQAPQTPSVPVASVSSTHHLMKQIGVGFCTGLARRWAPLQGSSA